MQKPISQTECLMRALDTLRRSTSIDPETKDEIVKAVEEAIEQHKGDARAQYARALFRMRNARTEALRSHFAKLGQEVFENNVAGQIRNVPQTMIGDWERTRISSKSIGPGAEGGSLEAIIFSRYNALLGQLEPIFKKIVKFGFPRPIETPEAIQLQAALRGEKPANAEIAKLVKLWRDATNPLLDELLDLGVYVARMENHFPQTYDVSRVAAATRRFKELLTDPVDGLDPRMFPDRAEAADHLVERLLTRHLDEPHASTLTLGRVYQMNTPRGEMKLAKEFGAGMTHEIMTAYLMTLVRKIETARYFGPRPNQGFEFIHRKVGEKLKQVQVRALGSQVRTDIVAKQDSEHRMAKTAFDALVNPRTSPANQSSAAWGLASDGWLQALVLGGTFFYRLGQDAVVAFSRALLANGGMRGMKDTIVGMAKSMGDAGFKRFAQDYGAGLHFYGAATRAERFSTGETVQYTATGAQAPLSQRVGDVGRQASAVTRAITLDHFAHERYRAGLAYQTARNFTHYSSMAWSDLPAAFRGLAENSGWTERLWNRLRDARAGAIDPATGVIVASRLPKDVERIFRAHVWRQMEIGTINPMLNTRLLAGVYGPENSIVEVLYRRVGQFGLSPLSFVQNAMAQQWHYGTAPGTVAFMGAMLAASIWYVQLRTFVTTGDVYALDNPELLTKAVVASGFLTPIGDQFMRDVGGGAVSSIPILGFLARFSGREYQAIEALVDGDYDKALFKATQGLEGVTPNWWWLDAMTNRGLVMAAEALNPEYARYRRNLREERLEGIWSGN